MGETRNLFSQRKQKLEELRKRGIPLFPNDFTVHHTTGELRHRFEGFSSEQLEQIDERFTVAGRVMSRRSFGKAAFLNLQDRSGQLQAYIVKNSVGDEAFAVFKEVDIGDFIGVTGHLFRTRTHELTLKVEELKLLVKSLRPLPEKWHGLVDTETRYRKRYLDLIVNPRTRDTFLKRTRIVQTIRDFLNRRDFIEVETPMMQPLAGGALAKPFKTHHNALSMELFLRIAPELYLKRLLVGGFERVYEINRNFRNEGLSSQHNPEFTMVEFYQAYATYTDLMELTEEMVCTITTELFGTLKVPYLGEQIDFTRPWKRTTLREAVSQYTGIPAEALGDKDELLARAQELHIHLDPDESVGHMLNDLLETAVVPRLIQPTFITNYPVEVSPLSRRSETCPEEVDRFELFMGGKEIANAFSELNDPVDQRERFLEQLASAPSDEESRIDEDFLMALEHGMPPAAGEGIGIDRLTMILTDSASIRDVILFPLLKSEKT